MSNVFMAHIENTTNLDINLNRKTLSVSLKVMMLMSLGFIYLKLISVEAQGRVKN